MNLPTIKIRAFSNDQYQLDKVFYSNYYKIKGFKESDKQPVVLDIGAYNGSSTFSFAALGAKKIYTLEIHPDNYKLLLQNTESFGDKIIAYNLGVYTENTILDFKKMPPLVDNIYYDFSEIKLVEDYNSEIEYYSIPVFTLDKIISNLCYDDEIDILKINIGYAELTILEQMDRFARNVVNICLETSEDNTRIDRFLITMKSKGFNDTKVFNNQEDGKTLVLLSRNKLEDTFLV